MKKKLLTAATMLVACLAFAALPQALAAPSMFPRPVLVKAHGLTARSTVGSFCTTSVPDHGSQVRQCADFAYPLPVRGRLPARAGDVIHLRFRHNPAIVDRIENVRMRVLQVDADSFSLAGHAHHEAHVPGHPNRWIARLPHGIQGPYVLEALAGYPGPDGADFWAGLWVRPGNG